MSFQAYLDNIETKTGKTPRELLALATERGLDGPAVKAGAIVDWLKADFDLGRGHAMALVHVIKHGPKIPASTSDGRRAPRRHRHALAGRQGDPTRLRPDATAGTGEARHGRRSPPPARPAQLRPRWPKAATPTAAGNDGPPPADRVTGGRPPTDPPGAHTPPDRPGPTRVDGRRHRAAPCDGRDATRLTRVKAAYHRPTRVKAPQPTNPREGRHSGRPGKGATPPDRAAPPASAGRRHRAHRVTAATQFQGGLSVRLGRCHQPIRARARATKPRRDASPSPGRQRAVDGRGRRRRRASSGPAPVLPRAGTPGRSPRSAPPARRARPAARPAAGRYGGRRPPGVPGSAAGARSGRLHRHRKQRRHRPRCRWEPGQQRRRQGRDVRSGSPTQSATVEAWAARAWYASRSHRSGPNRSQ